VSLSYPNSLAIAITTFTKAAPVDISCSYYFYHPRTSSDITSCIVIERYLQINQIQSFCCSCIPTNKHWSKVNNFTSFIRPSYTRKQLNPTMKPSHHPSPGPNRPSLANTSTSASTTDSPRNWEESDIRSDLAAGWGNNNNGGAVAGVPPVEPPANDWGWKLTTQAVRPLPPFYPLDPRSTRKLLLATQPQPGDGMSDVSAQSPQMDKNLHSIEAISNRISKACQHLSIQVEWDNGIPYATLLTMEMVEMVISMYLGGDEGGIMMGGKQSGKQMSAYCYLANDIELH
jgi:hypothetical protein